MIRRALAGPIVAGTLCLLVTTASAQQMAPVQVPAAPAAAATTAPAPAAPAPAAAALPPGSPLIGRPENNPAAAKLAPGTGPAARGRGR